MKHSLFYVPLVTAVLLIFLFNTTPVYSQTKPDTITGYHVKLKLATTSDWTEIKFDSASSSFYMTHDTILGSLANNYNYYNIIRADTMYTAVEYDLFYPVIPSGGISLKCTKGYWGTTTLTATISCGQDTSLSIQNTVVPGDSLNTKTMVIPTLFLQCADAETLLLPSPAACPKLLAFYYPWYGSPSGPTGHWVHWNPAQTAYNAPDTPSLGYYDSYDYTTIVQHINWAKQAGIEGFICSWWGVGDFTDGAIQRDFQVADTSSFSLSLYYEPSDIGSLASNQRVQRCIDDITYIINTYSSHPAMLRYDGKPVLFIYGATLGLLNLAQWQQVINAVAPLNCLLIADRNAPGVFPMFDGWHSYNPVAMSYNELSGMNTFAGSHANLAGKIYAATASPGFLTVSRQGGFKYYSQLGASLAYWPHYILITSFNEWHEASEIEPSKVYGDSYLNYTRAFRDYLDSVCSVSTDVYPLTHEGPSHLSNFPNPFSSSTTITFSLPDRSDAELTLWDAMGRKIKTLINSNLSAGAYFYTLNNDELQDGIYFCRLQTSGFVSVLRLIVQ